MCSSASVLSQRAACQSMGVSHTGAFQLAEVDLAALVPEEALVPFAEELQSRDRRRERRVKVRAVSLLITTYLNDMALCMQRWLLLSCSLDRSNLLSCSAQHAGHCLACHEICALTMSEPDHRHLSGCW